MIGKKVNPLIREGLSIADDRTFTLTRRTRAGVPNVNGYTYTDKAFEIGMKRYLKDQYAGLYLAPVSFSESSFESYGRIKAANLVMKANTEIYARFNKSMPAAEYRKFRVASIVSWDEYTMTFRRLDNMDKRTEELFEKYVNDESTVQMRYSADIQKGIIREMNIICFDLSVIPCEELGIDIKKICEGN